MAATERSTNAADHLIDQSLTIVDAKDARASLVSAIERASPQNRLGLELTGSDATAPALQLIISGARALADKGAFSGFGPFAVGVLDTLAYDFSSQG